MTTALFLFLTVSIVLTAVTVFMVNQIKNAPIGFENATGFHYGEPQQAVAPVAIAPVVAIDNSHHEAA